MIRWIALKHFLGSRPPDYEQISLSFYQVENIIGGELPPSAHKHRAFWANSKTHSHARNWMDIGRAVRGDPRLQRTVSFVRTKGFEVAREIGTKTTIRPAQSTESKRDARVPIPSETSQPMALIYVEGIEFHKICEIDLDSVRGFIVEHQPAKNYPNTRALQLHPYGHGPFCRFRDSERIRWTSWCVSSA